MSLFDEFNAVASMYYPDNMNLSAITETENDKAVKVAEEQLDEFRQALKTQVAEFVDRVAFKTGVVMDKDEVLLFTVEMPEVQDRLDSLHRAIRNAEAG